MDYEINRLAWAAWEMARAKCDHPEDVKAETLSILAHTIEHVSGRKLKPIDDLFVPLDFGSVEKPTPPEEVE